jgi:hypothetical protein
VIGALKLAPINKIPINNNQLNGFIFLYFSILYRLARFILKQHNIWYDMYVIL